MTIKCIKVGLFETNCYIIMGDKGNEYCLVVDPGDNWELIQKNIPSTVTHVILTHAHFDHIGALNNLLEKFPKAKLCYNTEEDVSVRSIRDQANRCMQTVSERLFVGTADIELNEGTNLFDFKVLHTPGHTKGSICLYSAQDSLLISGDTLFFHGFGRTDLGGSRKDMVSSIKRLLTLPNETIVYPGHGESTTIREEHLWYNR